MSRETDLEIIVRDYATHDSWRCEHPPHFYFAGGPPGSLGDDCPCGLLGSLRNVGIDPTPWDHSKR